jgi:protein-disulfide isomerase
MHIAPSPRLLAALLALTLAAACKHDQKTAAGTTGGAGEPTSDTVVATFGDNQKVTFGELNAKVATQVYDLRKQALDNMVNQKLVEAEAKKRNLTEEQLIKAEVQDKASAPSDAEVQGFFQQLQQQGRIPPDAPMDALKPQLVQALGQRKQQERAQEFITQLKTAANVKTSLPAPRAQVAATGPSKGPENAQVTIVEFSDFQCPFCGRAATTLDEVMKGYEGKVRLVFRHFPLNFHPEAPKAAEASLCAADQGKFWEYHDKLFQNQRALQVPQLKEYATQVGLDAGKFNTCLDSGGKAATVQKDMKDGEQLGVTGTPGFFVNGRFLNGALPAEEFKKIIDEELAAGGQKS